ncbi:unnamed protein product [Bemisia tabaci]|uniref:SET domain-containing protein n=1 Tax=Bemisia tabaci TaxID=7038 RepID=A0A9P0F514_BEMTA|nr:unnamed protein product [Bemisia tabaci]
MADKFKIEKKDTVGRYAVSTCDLKPSDVILTEEAFVVGPKATTVPVCLGCFVPVDCSYLCSKCTWPVCNPECESSPYHAPECQVFSAANAKYQVPADLFEYSPQLDCVTPLRLLLASESNSKRWNEEVKDMEAHIEARKKTPYWENEQTNVVKFLRERCKLERFSEDLIHTACGILEVNAFEVRSSQGYTGRGLFPKTALMSHNCVSNTCHSIVPSKNYKLILRATVDVKKGEELFTSYTQSLLPTMVRRENLLDSKYFHCACPRCSDPTELNTHMSSLKCTKCDNGIIISTDPLDAEAEWTCTHCQFKLRGEQVRRIYRVIQTEIDGMPGEEGTPERIEAIEKLLKQYRSVLHPKHAYLTILRHSLSELYGRAEGYTFEDLPDILLERKVELCQQILSVLDVIEPGYSRMRGMILYELHVPMMLFARSRYQYGEIDDATLRRRLEEVAKILEEAVAILSLEDPTMGEGIVAQMAQESLGQLRASIATLPQP